MRGEETAPGTLDEAARRRRHPAERRTSRYTGLLLILIIPQAAFGYALVGLTTAQWVRDTHFLFGLVVLVFVGLVAYTTRRLPKVGRRSSLLRFLGQLLGGLAAIQLVLGLVIRGWIPSGDSAASGWHLGIGLMLTFLVAAAHITAIGPSLLLSARREQEKALAQADRRQPPG